MKQLQTIGNSLIVVEVPKDAYDFGFMKHNNSLFYWLTSNKTISEGNGDMIRMDLSIENLKILGKLSELSGEECSKYVKTVPHRQSNYDLYYNYVSKGYSFGSPQESFVSLLQSNDIDLNGTTDLLIIEIL